MKQIILVTGGAGYIGSHVCKTLSENGFLPVTYDNLCSGNEFAVKWGPFEKGDIRDRANLAKTIEIYKPAAIMHFAALIQVADSVKNPADFYDNNVYGSLCLLEEARKAEINNMVFSSTAAVYGVPKSKLIKETAELAPINPYGQTKLTMENMIRDFSESYGLNHAILRYFNAAGADAESETGSAYKIDTHIIPLLMQVANGDRKNISIFGDDYDTPDGTAMRDYIHVTDLADAHVLALKHIMDGKGNLTLNLGTNHGHSVKDVVEAARKITGKKIPALNAERREGDPPVLVANATKAQKELNWKPQHSSLDNIIGTAWDWKRKQAESGFVNDGTINAWKARSPIAGKRMTRIRRDHKTFGRKTA